MTVYADDGKLENESKVFEYLSELHTLFYVLHHAVFDSINWDRRSRRLNPHLYVRQVRSAPQRPQLSPEQLAGVLSKLGL